MTAPAVIYLHGFNSAPQTVKGRMLARAAATTVGRISATR